MVEGEEVERRRDAVALWEGSVGWFCEWVRGRGEGEGVDRRVWYFHAGIGDGRDRSVGERGMVIAVRD